MITEQSTSAPMQPRSGQMAEGAMGMTASGQMPQGGHLYTQTNEIQNCVIQALPAETVTADIHCVTRWSKLDTQWRGVSMDTLLSAVEHDRDYILAFCDGGYTTDLPIADVTGGQAWVAYRYDGGPLDPEQGGPARLLVPHLYFWKSAK
jgi:hypothetical protein